MVYGPVCIRLNAVVFVAFPERISFVVEVGDGQFDNDGSRTFVVHDCIEHRPGSGFVRLDVLNLYTLIFEN